MTLSLSISRLAWSALAITLLLNACGAATGVSGLDGSSPSMMAAGNGIAPSIPLPMGVDPGNVGGNFFQLAFISQQDIDADYIFISAVDFENLLKEELARRREKNFDGPSLTTPDTVIFIEPSGQRRTAANVRPGCAVCPGIGVFSDNLTRPAGFSSTQINGVSGFIAECTLQPRPECQSEGPGFTPGVGLE